jgi:type III secretion system low calcium response chaperone LcrH/SycD
MSETLSLGTLEFSGLTPLQKKAMEVLGAGGMMKDIRGLSGEEIETVYSIGFNLYNQGKYAQAEPMFQFACFYAHLEPRYWMALGNCRQMLKNYPAAIDAYGFAFMIDIEDPWPTIQTAICYLATGNKELAGDSLTLAENAIKDKPNETARQRISALRQAL